MNEGATSSTARQLIKENMERGKKFRIFKYPLLPEDEQVVSIPIGSKLLSVAEQRHAVVVYAIVPVDVKETKDVKIWVHGTGHHLLVHPSDMSFLGTVNLYDGKLMFHVFCQIGEKFGE